MASRMEAGTLVQASVGYSTLFSQRTAGPANGQSLRVSEMGMSIDHG